MDFGFWILEFGVWILDFGFWVLDFGFWILILDFGFWSLDFGVWISLVFVLFVAAPNGAVWILEFGVWILEFGFWILEFGFWILDFGLDEASTDIVWILHKIFPCHADSGRWIIYITLIAIFSPFQLVQKFVHQHKGFWFRDWGDILGPQMKDPLCQFHVSNLLLSGHLGVASVQDARDAGCPDVLR